MAIEHVLTQSDTIYSLAETYLNDPARWKDIVDYNRLTAPYIVESVEEKNNVYSSGYLTLVRASTQNALSIPAGWTFHTKPYIIGGMVKTFRTTERTTIPAGTAVFYVHATCTEPGTYGNVSEGLITESGDEFSKAGISFIAITNEQTFEGGADAVFLTVGDSIYIPSDSTDVGVPEDTKGQLEIVGGEDLLLTPESGNERYLVADGFGDIRTISGIDNIKQAVNDRLMTEKGELPLHPEYGTNIASIIGKQQTAYTAKLVEIDIYDALSYEDRIQNVVISLLNVVGTTVEVELTFNPAYTTREMTMSLSLDYTKRR